MKALSNMLLWWYAFYTTQGGIGVLFMKTFELVGTVFKKSELFGSA